MKSGYVLSTLESWPDRPGFMTETVTAYLSSCATCGQEYANRIRVRHQNGLFPLDPQRNSSIEHRADGSDCAECRKREQNRRRVAAFRERNRTGKSLIACEHCGELFMPQRSTAKFCSAKCRVAASRAK